MDLLEQFRNYLKEKGNSPNTVKNYLSDLSTFVDYLKSENQYFSILTLPFVFNNEKLVDYKNWLTTISPTKTANRKLSALRKFMDFCVRTNLVEKNYVGNVGNIIFISDQPNINRPIGLGEIELFRKYLKSQGNSSNTVKGYISDVKYYLGIRSNASTTLSSVSRRLYSIKKFTAWQQQRQIAKTPTFVNPITSPTPINPKYYFVLAFIVLISTLTVSLIFQKSIHSTTQIFGRLKGLQSLIFEPSTEKNWPPSLNLVFQPKLIDPMQTGETEVSQPSFVALLKNVWNPPPLIDPLN
jgi:hypothetical protein